MGSSTVVLVTINLAVGRMQAATLGDSGVFVIGRQAGGSRLEVKFRTPQQVRAVWETCSRECHSLQCHSLQREQLSLPRGASAQYSTPLDLLSGAALLNPISEPPLCDYPSLPRSTSLGGHS